MTEAIKYTTAEAAFVLGIPVRAVKKALEEGPVQAAMVKKAGSLVRTIDQPDLVFLYAIQFLKDELTPKARTDFYRAFHDKPAEGLEEVKFGRISVIVSDLYDEVEKRTQQLSALSEKVEFTNTGEPLIRGTEIEVHRISALLDGGLTVEEIIQDYPSLTRDQILAARSYAEAHPKPGRPYPRNTAKRALREAQLDALDEVFADDKQSE